MCSFRKFCTSVINNKHYFVTTPIYYVNAEPHLGHLYSSLVADFAQRWHRMRNDDKVIFCTGTDEHGTKIQQAAAKNNSNILDYCTKVSKQYKTLSNTFDINYTHFNRTTDLNHKTTVTEFWKKIDTNGHIYLSQYKGWYCISDETFLSNSQLKEQVLSNGEKVLLSAESGHPVEWTEEQNYMFKLSSLIDDLKYWLRTDEKRVRPDKFYRQVQSMLDSESLGDVSISRPTSRVPWGIPVPSDPSHTIYVWLDALCNYLTPANPLSSEFQNTGWPVDIHVIGKDILKFHAIYWPAFLIAAGLEPPKGLFVHSHWTVDGVKMSKSRGNVVNPNEAANIFTPDGLRYFLLREAVPHTDANYSEEKVRRVINSELADTLGNLVSRSCGKAINPLQRFPELPSVDLGESEIRLTTTLSYLPHTVNTHYNNMDIRRAIDEIISTLHQVNGYFEASRPWELSKKGDWKKLDVVLNLTLEAARTCATLLRPVVPRIADRVLDRLNVDARRWIDVTEHSWTKKIPSRSLNADVSNVLFKRILFKDKVNKTM